MVLSKEINKECIFLKTNISYPLIRTYVKHVSFLEHFACVLLECSQAKKEDLEFFDFYIFVTVLITFFPIGDSTDVFRTQKNI